MSIDTKAVIAIKDPVHHVFDIVDTIDASIRHLMHEHPVVKQWKESNEGIWHIHLVDQDGNRLFSLPQKSIGNYFIVFNFTFNGEKRSMFVHFSEPYGGYERFGKTSVRLDLGMWGSSTDLCADIAIALAEQFNADAWLIPNDCADDALENASHIFSKKTTTIQPKELT